MKMISKNNTDASVESYQHIQNLSFGKSFISQKVSSYDVRYKFTGKERDAETGYDYFGARYYSSELSVWLSVDPLADKYPNESPYCYAGLNPVMITDPNGMWKDEGDGKWTAEKGDSWWSLHKQSGMTWKETMAYAKKYNAGKGRDNWKTVRVGDQVSVGGSGQKSSQGNGDYLWSSGSASANETTSNSVTSPSASSVTESASSESSTTSGNGDNTYLAGALLVSGGLLSDDISGVGAVDNILIPFIIGGAYILDKVSSHNYWTSRGNPDDWSFDPEIKRLQNDKYYPPGSPPPKWFWPAIGATATYEIYKNWPRPNLPQSTQPVDKTYVAPRFIYPEPIGN
jgi:RHS repeat-associated protein